MTENLKNTHDLTLGDWGPYSKKYAGISHIANSKEGIRFDLSVFPGFYRRKVELPLCMAETNFHPWQASSDLSYFSTRHELEWKDEVFADISYSKQDDDTYIICADCANNTDNMQNLVLHYMASIQYPSINAKYDEEFLAPVSYNLPKSAKLIYAIDFCTYKKEIVEPTDSLVADGYRRGEFRGNGFNRGSGVLNGSQYKGEIIYKIQNSMPFKTPKLVIRCKNNFSEIANVEVNGDIFTTFSINPSDDFQIISMPCTLADKAELNFSVKTASGNVIFDSFILCENSEIEEINIEYNKFAYKATAFEHGSNTAFDLVKEGKSLNVIDKNAEHSIILKYDHSDFYYGIYWDFDDYNIRYWNTDRLDYYFKIMASDHVTKVLKDAPAHDNEEYTNIFMRPIPIAPNEKVKIYGAVCCGKTLKEVQEKIAKLKTKKNTFNEIITARQNECLSTSTLNQASNFGFSQDIMMATTATNVVYPIYTKGQYIKHNTPGRWWDSLYTWDSGFCGLGLATFDAKRAIDCLNAYVTEIGDEETAFIHHGSPVPVQFYLFLEIFNNCHDKELAEYFYPRLKQYYLFMAGKLGSSDMARLPSGLLNTWSYFYNSSGCDDYPPQVYVHAEKRQDEVACVLNTSHAIRCAKILRQFAEILGEKQDDISMFDAHIAELTNSIQAYTWDADCGYFSYTEYSENKIQILRKNGENFNKGLDGISPIIAGILTDEQLEKVISNMTDTSKLMTPIGLSTVDQSAGYYKKDGYWNGAVWMPHQWFCYKALLDYGFADEAYKIAELNLISWEKEVQSSYNCFEHFIINSGRGAGWHHFSGLSTPVLSWHKTYYEIGSITCGFGAVIKEKTVSEKQINATIQFENSSKTSIIITMPKAKNYNVTLNGKNLDFNIRNENVIEITTVVSLGDMELVCKAL